MSKLIICLSGKAGSGKSTLGKKLAKVYGLKYVSGGDTLKNLAHNLGYNNIDEGWWETNEGQQFLKERQSSLDFDRKIDNILIGMAKKGDVVIDSWTIPWLIKNNSCIKIWLEATQELRAQRVANRDGISLQKAYKMIKEKDKISKQIYKKLYGFNFGDDFSPFDLVINIEKFDSIEIFLLVSIVVDIFKKKYSKKDS